MQNCIATGVLGQGVLIENFIFCAVAIGKWMFFKRPGKLLTRTRKIGLYKELSKVFNYDNSLDYSIDHQEKQSPRGNLQKSCS